MIRKIQIRFLKIIRSPKNLLKNYSKTLQKIRMDRQSYEKYSSTEILKLSNTKIPKIQIRFKDYQITEEFIRKIIQKRFKKSGSIDRATNREIFFDIEILKLSGTKIRKIQIRFKNQITEEFIGKLIQRRFKKSRWIATRNILRDILKLERH